MSSKLAIIEHTAFIHEPRKLPVVLSPQEMARFLDAAPGLKYKAALSVAYGAGLRAAEVVSLKISDIDSERMVIRVEQGKGRKDRYVMLSPHLLALHCSAPFQNPSAFESTEIGGSAPIPRLHHHRRCIAAS